LIWRGLQDYNSKAVEEPTVTMRQLESDFVPDDK